MSHDHDHHHHIHPGELNKAFTTGIILNLGFVIAEVIAGLSIHSLALLSDAGHNLADVGALALSLLAFRMLKTRSNKKYTYGYRKTSILVALFNATVLIVSAAIILYEAVTRIFNPVKVSGLTISLIAALGIFVNFVSARMFMKGKEKDLNVKSVYLHLMADALISLGIVFSGLLVYYFKLYWIDPAVSIVVVIFIIVSTWHLLTRSLRLSLDGVPVDIDLNDIKEAALKVEGVKDIHHVHIWALSTAENALTAHLVLAQNATPAEEVTIKNNLRHALQHKNIQHITLETEREDENCETGIC